MSRYEEIDINKVKTVSAGKRKSKVSADQLARTVSPDGSFVDYWDSLPDILASRDLRRLVQRIVEAVRRGKPVLAMMGAHVIKVGLSPIVIDLMEQGVVSGIALNGAGVIHDVELAYFGKTSEDVASSLGEGLFGMAEDTAELVNGTISKQREAQVGFGEALGQRILDDAPPHLNLSILGQAFRMRIPVTVHVAIGTDIVHQHPTADGAAIGELSLRDFRIWSHLVSEIDGGGVVLLFGSSVVLPEVFLKALTVARNVKECVHDFTTANFDMIRHYRPRMNFVERPTLDGGEGYAFVGHHEIMIPLLAAAVKQGLAASGK